MSTSREITIVSTKNTRVDKVQSSARTWGELISEIQGKYELNKLKAVENVNKTTLENVDSVLPEGPFRLFLRPVQTKSGAVDFSTASFSELRAEIKKNDSLKEYLNTNAKVSGRNWTQLKTEELRVLVPGYFAEPKAKKSSNSKKADNGITEVVEAVAQSKETATPVEQVPVTIKEKLDEIIADLMKTSEVIKSELNDIEDYDSAGEVEERIDEIVIEVEAIKEIVDDNDLNDVTVEVIPLFHTESSYLKESTKAQIPVEAATPVESEEEKAARLEREDIEREMRELEEGSL